MDLKVIRRAEDRYALWSTRVSDVLVEGVTREELVTWYLDRKPDGGREEIERLVEAADERAGGDVGPTSYEDAAEFLSGE